MKKLLLMFLIGAMLLTLVSCGGNKQTSNTNSKAGASSSISSSASQETGWKPAAATVTDADKKEKFVDAVKGDKAQGPVWYYLSDDGTGFKELFYTEKWGDNWQYSENPEADGVYYSICDWNGFKIEAGKWGQKNIKIAVAWNAYQDGTATIGPWDYTCFDGRDELKSKLDGINVKILKGTTELFSGDTKKDGDNKFAGTSVPVKKGDVIFFVVDGQNAPVKADGPVANVAINTISVKLE